MNAAAARRCHRQCQHGSAAGGRAQGGGNSSCDVHIVRNAVPELASDCTALIAATDFGVFYNDDARLISHGFYANTGARSLYDYGMLYTEARLGSLIAIGKGDVPEAEWFEMVRIFPPECGGQLLTPEATRTIRVGDHDVLTGYYAQDFRLGAAAVLAAALITSVKTS